MNPDELKKIFLELKKTLDGVQSFHETHKNLYDGLYQPYDMKLVNDKKLARAFKGYSDWCKIAIDYPQGDTVWDAFENDTFGLTKFLVDAEADAVIDSAKLNATRAGCSFVAIMPRENDVPIFVPFSGAEATGISEARSGAIKYGITVKRVNGQHFSQVEEYYFFTPGHIYIVKSDGEFIDGVELPVKRTMMVEFKFQVDLATRPHGKPRISEAAISAMDSNLQCSNLAKITGLTNIKNTSYLLTGGAPEDLQSVDTENTIGKVKVFFQNTPDGSNNATMTHPKDLSSKDVIAQMEISAGQFASSVSMPITAFGYQPSNGSFSGDTLTYQDRPYNNMVDSMCRSFGDSIKRMAILGMELHSGSTDHEYSSVTPVFRGRFELAKIGQLGDAIGKIGEVFQDFGKSSFIRQQLGLPLRPELMSATYPDSKQSRKMREGLKVLQNEIIGEDGEVDFPKGSIHSSVSL